MALVFWGRDGSGSVLDLLARGWDTAVGALDFEAEQVIPLIDAEQDIREVAESGAGLIIVELFSRGLVEEIALDYPETSFVVFDGEPADNVTSIHFVRENGAYLMGVAAGLQSESGRVGFIGGAQSGTTETRRAAYAQGARSVNPAIDVVSVYLGPSTSGKDIYFEVELARQAAEAMYRDDVDVIFHSAGQAAAGIAEAAEAQFEETGAMVWVIGSETDEYLVRPQGQREHVLTSMYKRWDEALVTIIESYLAGELDSGVVEFDIDSNLVAYSTQGGHIGPHLAAIDAVSEDLMAGTVVALGTATEPPRWTREIEAAGSVVFDGQACSYDIPLDLRSGQVFRFDIANQSSVAVGTSVWGPDWGLSSWTAPGASNALAAVGGAEEWYVECFTAGGPDMEGRAFTIESNARCDLEVLAIDPSDPASVLSAYADAVNDRDIDVVCSLLAKDAVLHNFFGESHVGAAAIAELLTPGADDTDFVKYVVTDVEVDDNVLVISDELHTVDGIYTANAHRITVENGKIVEWVFGEFSMVTPEAEG